MVDLKPFEDIFSKNSAKENMDLSTGQVLSNSVYSDPQGYLESVKKNFATFDANANGTITKSDLQDYLKRPFDPKTFDADARAAAKTTLAHFDEIKEMGAEMQSGSFFPHADSKGISKDDVKVMDDAIKHDPSSYIASEQRHLENVRTVNDILTGANLATAAQFALRSNWRWAALSGVASVAGLGSIIANNDYIGKAGGLMTGKLEEQEVKIRGWSEFERPRWRP